MDQWKNRVAVVTGSSSGIGAQISKDLACKNIIVAALARREERLQENKKSLPEEFQKHYHCYQCDVTDIESLEKTFKLIEENLGGIDILINNAGMFKPGLLTGMDRNDVQDVFSLNVTAVIDCTRLAFKSMQKRNVNGHVIMINSVCGHKCINYSPESVASTNCYTPSKYAITSIAEIYRQEFRELETEVKITSISPGLVESEASQKQIKRLQNKKAYLRAKDISDAVQYVLGTPPNVQVHELTIKPVGELF